MEKPYELRKLTANDIFPMCQVLNKIGFKEIKTVFNKDNVKAIIEQEKNGGEKANAESVGLAILLDIGGIVLANIENCKGSLYKFLSGVSGMTEEEIGNLDMAVFAEMIFDVVKKEEFTDFFKVVSRLFK